VTGAEPLPRPPAAPLEPVRALVDRWLAARAALRALDEAGHPDLTDGYGRTWTWLDHDLYRHDQMAWPREEIESGRFGLPGPKVRANPNYDLCPICRGEPRA
jgi:hypothetical protein